MLLSHQDRRLIRAIHLYQKHRSGRGPVSRLLCAWGKLGHMVWTVISASDVSRDAQIAPGTRFPHLTGVVVHQDAVIGEGCMIMQQVTLGQMAEAGAPRLEAGVYVGAGAKILGGVRIGRKARIGANAVVLADVPEDATAVGVPATVTRRGDPGSAV